jgi:predicted DNA-binding transcriptional regulator AlpA
MSTKHSPARGRGSRLSANDLDDRVMSFHDWCHLNGFSVPTGRRILASANGPKVIQLSERRIGIRHRDNRAWQESRIRDGA